LKSVPNFVVSFPLVLFQRNVQNISSRFAFSLGIQINVRNNFLCESSPAVNQTDKGVILREQIVHEIDHKVFFLSFFFDLIFKGKCGTSYRFQKDAEQMMRFQNKGDEKVKKFGIEYVALIEVVKVFFLSAAPQEKKSSYSPSVLNCVSLT
jgi:hypothetical protein